MRSSLSIWRYVVNAKSMVKISSIFVAFLENMSFTDIVTLFLPLWSGFREKLA